MTLLKTRLLALFYIVPMPLIGILAMQSAFSDRLLLLATLQGGAGLILLITVFRVALDRMAHERRFLALALVGWMISKSPSFGWSIFGLTITPATIVVAGIVSVLVFYRPVSRTIQLLTIAGMEQQAESGRPRGTPTR